MTKEQLMKQVQEDKKKLEELKPKYEDALKIAKSFQEESTKLKSELAEAMSRIERLRKDLEYNRNEYNKACLVIGAEYLKGVQV